MRAAEAARTIVVAGICGALYLRTLSPGLCFPGGDSHELALNAGRLGVSHPSGYPTFTWLGHAFITWGPGSDPAYRLNVMSAVLAAVTIGAIYRLQRTLAVTPLAAAFAALVFGCATTWWSQAVRTEIYTLDTCVLALTLWCVFEWAQRVSDGRGAVGWFAAFVLLYGVSLGTHLSNLTWGPLFAMFVIGTDPRIVRRPKHMTLAAAAFALAIGQYGWLLARGGLFDVYPNRPPDSLAGAYAYTIGAYENVRFAFPLAALPGRLYFYSRILHQNFAAWGVALGAAGMWMLRARQPAAWWLLLGLYVANVAFTTQLLAPDAEVFFLAGFLPWAVFMGFGVDAVTRRLPHSLLATSIATLVLAALLVPLARASFVSNDRRTDTVVDDFDRALFATLPPSSAVVGGRGMFGADLPFWQTVRGVRPDVTIVSQGPTPAPPHAARFAAVASQDGVPTRTGRFGLRASELPPQAWYQPVLFGNRHAQVLARITDEPPALLASAVPPAARSATAFGAFRLEGVLTELRTGGAAPRLAIESYWRRPVGDAVIITTRVGEHALESHDLGLGNLARYRAAVGLPPDALLAERYEVVVPSWLACGSQRVTLGVSRWEAARWHTSWIDVGDVALD